MPQVTRCTRTYRFTWLGLTSCVAIPCDVSAVGRWMSLACMADRGLVSHAMGFMLCSSCLQVCLYVYPHLLSRSKIRTVFPRCMHTRVGIISSFASMQWFQVMWYPTFIDTSSPRFLASHCITPSQSAPKPSSPSPASPRSSTPFSFNHPHSRAPAPVQHPQFLTVP